MDQTVLGRNLAGFAPGISSQPITKVELLDENGDVVGVSGSDTGRTLTALQPDGTNAMAAAILTKVSGYKHIGYEGRKALLDPAAELGDAVTVDGLYVPLIALDVTFDVLYAPDISAPDADEIDDEYPYKSPTQRQIERNMAKTRSLITKTSEAIMLKVEGIDGKYTEVKTTLDGLTVTDQSGTTKIKGSSIETGSITADKIDATNLKVAATNITGSLTIGQLPSEVAKTSQIPTRTSQLSNDSSYQTEQGVTQIIGGKVTADYVNALGVEAVSLVGNTIGIKYRHLGGDLQITEGLSGHLTTYDTSSGPGLGMVSESGLKLLAGSGSNVFIACNGGGNNSPFIVLDYGNNNVQLGGGRLVIGSAMYGNTPPSNPVQGTLYFLRKS